MLKNLSLRMKITLWIGTLLGILVLFTYTAFYLVTRAVMMKSLQSELVRTVAQNYDEIGYIPPGGEKEEDSDLILHIPYKDGTLEVEDDFLKAVGGITTALCREDGTLLYGENPVARGMTEEERRTFRDGEVREKKLGAITWYIYDRALSGEGLQGLFLRGMVPSVQGERELDSILRYLLIILPLLLLVGLPVGYLIADRSLLPVRRIIGTAERISEGDDLGQRIGLGEGGDELHRMAAAYDAMFDRLEESFEAEKKFTSDASHELRTPLSVILAQCQLALEEDLSPEEYKEALVLIRRQGGRMSALIEDMLSLSRLERRTDRYPMEDTDLSGLLKDLCRDMELVMEKDISLIPEISPEIRVRGNEELLRRMASNLIGNALRYGKEKGHIWVRLYQKEEGAFLEVEDDGPGIPYPEQKKVFERFYRGDAARSGKGSGLGLSIVRQIALTHGGKVTLESRPGKGALFRVVLPGGE